MDSLSAQLYKDLRACELRWCLFVAAASSFRRDSLLRPFPPGRSDSSEQSKDPYGPHKDFESVLADIHNLPSFPELLKTPSMTSLSALDLAEWVLTNGQFSLTTLRKEEFAHIETLTGEPGFAVSPPDFVFGVTYSPTVERRFTEARGDRTILRAYHGSRLENFHSILHNGLHCHMSKPGLFGEGVYLSSDLSLALLYSPRCTAWARCSLGTFLSCVAVCEIIDHPDVKCQVKGQDSARARVPNSEGREVPQRYYVVTNNQLLRVRYLLIYSQGLPQRASKRRSWILRHPFATALALYMGALLLLAAFNSPSVLLYLRHLFGGHI
uniref:protein mono-ADP-ribosyltransferase PARP16-like n=1 Tax=Myxine glutinosa TaxID=7769 RepID=UPI00358FC2CA